MSRWPGDSPDLTGLGAVITGASSGIGRHLATALTGYGAQVAALDADTARLAAWADPVDGVQVVGCDVRDEVAVNSAMTGFHGRTGDLSLVVNCAALAEHVNSQDISVERWRETLDVNLTGAFIVARAAARVMRGAGGGSVVLVGSQLGRVTRPERAAYSTSKAGVEMLAKVLALDFASWGVRVNCLAPGPVLTDRTRERLLGPDAESSGGRMLIGRYLEPADLVGAVLFLASPDSRAMTGATLLVDGGYSVV